jgi:sRNA-binding carbon storage regulator CsrA
VQAPRDIGVHRREVFERMVQWHGEELSNGR